MTPEERRLLTDLAGKIAQTPTPQRDAEAEDFIRKNIGSRPDALYLMTQTVLIQNMAIQQAQQQIRELQDRGSQTLGTGSFLGQAPQYSQQPPQYAPPQPLPPYSSAPAAPAMGQSAAPGFLRGAAQTAAGVAAGALAFEGVRSLFSHPGFGMGSGLGFGQTGFMGGGGMPVEETVINNNYYDSPGDAGRHEQRFTDTSDDTSNNQNDDDAQTQDVDYDDSSDLDDTSSSGDDSLT